MIQTAVRSFFIVLVAPGSHHLLGVAVIDEDVHVQTLVIEVVDVRIRSRVAGRDVERFGTVVVYPVLQPLRQNE